MSKDFLKSISLTLSFLIMIVCQTIAQEQPKIDSLITRLEKDRPDATKLTTYHLLTEALIALPDSALAEQYINEGIVFATDLDNDESRLDFMLDRVKLYYLLDAYERGIEWCERVMKESQQLKFMLTYAEAVRLRGKLEEWNDPDIANTYFEESILIAREIGHKRSELLALMEMGSLSNLQIDYNAAITYYKQAWDLSVEIDSGKYLEPLRQIGYNQTQLKEYDKALATYQNYLKIAEKLGYKDDIARALRGFGGIYTYQKNSQKALTFLHQSLTISREIGAPVYKTLVNIGGAHGHANNLDSAVHYFHLALKTSDSHLPMLTAQIGYIFLMQNHIDSGLFYTKKAATFYERNNANASKLWVLLNTGEKLLDQLQFDLALQHYFEALTIADATQDTLKIAWTFEQLAAVYLKQNEDSIALSYLRKALYLYENQNQGWLSAITTREIALYFRKSEQYEQSLRYYSEASNDFLQLGDSCEAGAGILAIGEIFALREQMDSAQHYSQIANNILGNCKNVDVVFKTHLLHGGIFEKKGKTRLAIEQYEQGLALAESMQQKPRIHLSLEKLYPVYEKTGQINKAYETYKRYDALNDSLFNADNTRLLAQKETAYAYEKANQERELLAQAERAAQEQQLITQRWISYVFVGAFVVVLFLGLAVYRNYRNKQKANLLLTEKNREIEKQKQELQELDQFKSNFFANVSHELRTPLTLISSPLEKVLQSDDTSLIPPSLQHTLKLVANNSNKLKGLVNDILDLSKLDSKKLELTLQAADLGAFVNRVFSNYESLARQLGIQYSCNTQGLSSDWVLLDSSRVEKVLNNLLFNALKYTPAGGTVQLHVTTQEDWIKAEVMDTGQGIAEVDLPFIFDRYFQSKQPDAPIQGGTGIGLALAHELTTLMGGTLTVASQLQEGTTFTLSLPLKTTAPAPDPFMEDLTRLDNELEGQTELPVIELKEKAHHILIVEDNPDMQMFVRELLEKDFHTYLSSNGKQALDLLDTHSIDLIISDVMMPEMDGYTLLQRLKESDSHRSIPVVMLTALDHEDSKLQALAIGVDDYLTKPFSPQELIARVNNLLARYQLRKQWVDEPQEVHTTDTVDATEDEPLAFVLISDIEWLKEVEERIREELENDDFLLSDLAESMHLSERGFQRKIKRITGLTPKQYQHEIALQKGRELLEKGVYGNVTAVAYSVGINHVSRFSNLYYMRFGKKPSEYFRVNAE